MFNLPATKYETTQRTVSGIVPVYPDDVVLNCDTSTAAVVIELAEIPDDYFSTQYKLYIVDISNNASVNNITIVAGAGQTINAGISVQISTNGGSVVVMISGNTSYTALQSNALIGPSSFIPVTYVQLSNLISTNTIVPNGDYLLLDAQFGSLPIIPTNVYLKGMTLNKVSLDGQGIFYNADYQGVGVYTGITGFAGQLGLWNLTLTPAINNVCIWNNTQYLNITGANGLTNPSSDAVNWQPLARQVNYGYIVEIDIVYYNSTNNNITYRLDKRGNEVESTILLGFNSLNCFKWGSQLVTQNSVVKNSICNNCNLTITGAISDKPFFSNVFEESFILFGLPNVNGSVNAFSNNKVNNSTITIENAAFEFLNNKIYNSNVAAAILTINGKCNNNIIETTILDLGNNSGVFTQNSVSDSNMIIATNSGEISLNTIKNVTSTIFINNNEVKENTFTNLPAFNIQNNTGFYNGNIIENCGVTGIGLLNAGIVTNNTVFNAKSFLINTNSVAREISANYVNTSLFFVATNNGDIIGNNISSSSSFTVTLNNLIVNNCFVSNASFLTIITNNGSIGVDANPKGLTITNGSSMTLTTVTANGFVSGVALDSYSIVDIGTLDITFDNCSLFNTGLKLLTTTFGSGTIEKLNCANVKFGSISFNLTEDLTGTSMNGNSTVSFTLDCSDPLVYDLLSQTLTISTDIAGFIGNYVLTNAAGLTITKIVNLTTNWNSIFEPDNGTVTFQSVAVGGAVVNNIVSQNGAFNYLVVYRAIGSDYIQMIRNTSVIEVSNAVILT